jgi:hypothetical protein
VLLVPGKKREVMFEALGLVPAACFFDSELCQSFGDISILRLWKMFSLAALGYVSAFLSLKGFWPRP